MRKYTLTCYNEKNKVVYEMHAYLKPEDFEKQLKLGYLRFRDESNLNREIICYLNIYNKIVIEEE